MSKELLNKVKDLHDQFDIGIVSAMRGADSPTVKELGVEDVDSWNAKNTNILQNSIQKYGFNAIPLLGSYSEEGGSRVREKSFLIWSEDNKNVKRFVVEAGSRFDQDSVIFAPKGEPAVLIYTNETSGKKGQTETLGNLKLDSNSEWASELEQEPGSKFVYEAVEKSEELTEAVEIYARAIKSMRL